MRRIQLLWCISVLCLVTVLCDLELKDIYLASKNAIASGNVTENKNVIDKYYLSHKKENSIWYISQKTALAIFNIDLSSEDYGFIEKLILSFGNHYQECIKLPRGVVKAQCFYHLAPKALDLETGSRWVSLPEVSVENKVKYGTLYNSISLFISHVALIAKDNFESFKDTSLSRFKLGDFIKALENVKRMQFDFDKDVIKWRVDAISPPIICQINQRFWKDFEGTCETRWRRSVDLDDEPEIAEEKRTIVRGANAIDTIPPEADYKAKEEDTILGRADRIGSSCSQGCVRFRVQIMDEVKREVLYEEEKIAIASSKGETMDVLALKAQNVRGKFIKDIKDNATKLAEETYVPNYGVIGDTLALLKQ